MARFDVYRDRQGAELMIDCQADVLSGLNTRFVVPLMAPEVAPVAARQLNPQFDVAGERLVMVTQFAAAIDNRLIGERVGSLAEEHPTIMNALDMLISGY